MAVLVITLKELGILLRDRRALALLLAMPLLLTAVLGFSAGRLFLGKSELKVPLAVANLDHSPLSEVILQQLAADPRIELLVTASSTTEADRAARDVEGSVVLEIGPGFSPAVAAIELIDLLDFPNGRLVQGPEALDLHVRVGRALPWTRDAIRHLIYYQVLNVIVPHTIHRLPLVKSYVDAYHRARGPGLDRPQPDPLATFSYFSGVAPSRDDIYRTLVPSYTVMFSFFLLNIMAFSFVGERNRGTLLRIHTAPIPAWQVIVGKVLPFFILSVIQAAVLLGGGRLLFGMPLGEQPLLLAPLVLCTSLAATGLGLLVAVLVRSEAQVTSFASLLVITLAALSGCLMPRMWMPQEVLTLSLVISPLSWSLEGYTEVLARGGPDPARILMDCAMLLLFAAAFFGAGLWKFSWSTPPEA